MGKYSNFQNQIWSDIYIQIQLFKKAQIQSKSDPF